MKISVRKLMFIILFIFVIGASFIILPKFDNFVSISKCGTVFILIYAILTILHEKKFLSPIVIMLLCFALFQYGLPFLYSIDSSFESWYVQQFSKASLIYSVKLTVICIGFFALGLICTSSFNKKSISFKDKNSIFSDSNKNNIYKFSKILFYVSAIIAFPLAIYVASLALKFGYTYIKEDSMNIYNTFTRFAQQMIVPANLLLIIFSRTKNEKKKWTICLIFYSVLLLFTGARTTSLAIFLTLLLLNDEFTVSKNSFKKYGKKIFTFALLFIVLFIGVFIAKFRYDGTVTSFSLLSVVESVVEEMGFNFTSLPFTRLFVNSPDTIKNGLSYVYSFICLVPRSLDPIGIIDHMHELLPETWLANSLHSKFNGLYDFGVGYSIIAEAYYNFGDYAFISVFIQGIIIGLFLKNTNNSSKFSVYIKYIMLYSLITYPRRTLITLLKSIEYCVVFVIILIYIYSILKRGEKK